MGKVDTSDIIDFLDKISVELQYIKSAHQAAISHVSPSESLVSRVILVYLTRLEVMISNYNIELDKTGFSQ